MLYCNERLTALITKTSSDLFNCLTKQLTYVYTMQPYKYQQHISNHAGLTVIIKRLHMVSVYWG